jgi:hypothetical protein
MNRFLRRLSSIGSAATLTVGLGIGAVALTAAPASAASGPCSDIAYASPTPAHTLPWDQSSSVNISKGKGFTGTCNYYNDTSESRWYMQIYWDNSIYYVWVQRLTYGKNHQCDYNGTLTGIDDPHNNVCPLYNYTPPS